MHILQMVQQQLRIYSVAEQREACKDRIRLDEKINITLVSA